MTDFARNKQKRAMIYSFLGFTLIVDMSAPEKYHSGS